MHIKGSPLPPPSTMSVGSVDQMWQRTNVTPEIISPAPHSSLPGCSPTPHFAHGASPKLWGGIALRLLKSAGPEQKLTRCSAHPPPRVPGQDPLTQQGHRLVVFPHDLPVQGSLCGTQQHPLPLSEVHSHILKRHRVLERREGAEEGSKDDEGSGVGRLPRE